MRVDLGLEILYMPPYRRRKSADGPVSRIDQHAVVLHEFLEGVRALFELRLTCPTRLQRRLLREPRRTFRVHSGLQLCDLPLLLRDAGTLVRGALVPQNLRLRLAVLQQYQTSFERVHLSPSLIQLLPVLDPGLLLLLERSESVPQALHVGQLPLQGSNHIFRLP